ncbi:hypothetical protein LENED_001471 [Lentinula edodes]|uniref:Uncharacterized protein n=1 Tax=Lentinula edodes TaxID=5353 RepID=A0A1Q3DYQ0_LENED|nr:hypothetical protein LENED_001471 [Lentinula edodes]
MRNRHWALILVIETYLLLNQFVINALFILRVRALYGTSKGITVFLCTVALVGVVGNGFTHLISTQSSQYQYCMKNHDLARWPSIFCSHHTLYSGKHGDLFDWNGYYKISADNLVQFYVRYHDVAANA